MFFYNSPYENTEKKKKVDKFLLEQQAKSDALYPYQKNSPEPVIEGAFKGALASSIAAKAHEYYKKEKNPEYRLRFKPFLGYSLGGAFLGGALNYVGNLRKVKQKKEALDYLYDNRSRKYIQDKQKLLKTSRINHQMVNGSLDEEDREKKEVLPEKTPQKKILKDSIFSGTIGSAIGGVASALMLRKPGAFKKGAISGAALGSSNSAVSEELDNQMHDQGVKMSLGQQMALTGAAAAAAEPLIYRAIGYGSGKINNGEFAKSLLKPSVDEKDVKKVFKDKVPFKDGYEAAKYHSENFNKKTFGEKLKSYFLPNLMQESKKFYDSDDVDMYKGMKGKLVDKQLLGHMASKAAWGALLGYLPVKAVETLQNHRKQKQMNS